MSDLKPASELAKRFGVKCLAYGPPGVGKTPIIKTAPRPVVLAVEPGLLSMRDATNIPAFEAETPAKIDDFFNWFFGSKEATNFDTLCIDSISQLAEVYLTQELKRNKDGRKAYGDLSRKVMEIANALYYLPNKHVYLIAKMGTYDENGTSIRKPYFPGQDLNIKIPHLFDEVIYIDKMQIPGVAQPTLAFRTQSTYGIHARDRSGRLAEFEPPHLGQLFQKCST